MFNFHYVFPIKMLDQPDLYGEHKLKVATMKYDYDVDYEVYWDLVADYFVKDWFPSTYDQLSSHQRECMHNEALELCISQDYVGAYDDAIHEQLLQQAWHYFCETQTVQGANLYKNIPFDIIKGINGYATGKDFIVVEDDEL